MTNPSPAAPAPRRLRDYQIEAVDAVESAWAEGTTRVGVVAATGLGKSTMIAQLAVNAYDRGQRVVMLAHRAELIDQMVDTVRVVGPHIPADQIGVVRAANDDHHAAIVGATLQTLGSVHRLRALGRRHVILWDEVHHAAADGFHATFQDLGGYNDALMAGFTATMRRQTRGHVGLGDVIEKIVFDRNIKWAVENDFLVRPRGLTVRLDDLNALNNIRSVAGDFNRSQLATVMAAATQYVVDAVKMHAGDRRPIIFASSVETSHAIADALNEAGYTAVAVTGEQPYEQRQVNYAAFRLGTVQALVTVMVLTEGADFPMCDTVVLARPTRSPNLYSQMIGRALRLHPGKEDALVLDLTGSARQMRLTQLSQILPGVESRVVGGDGVDIVEEVAQTVEERELSRTVAPKLEGPVRMVTFDVVEGKENTTLWLETHGGVPFVPLDDGWVVHLYPRNGERGSVSYMVGSLNTRTRKYSWLGAREYLPLDKAVAKAEAAIPAAGFKIPRATAQWRRGQIDPTADQIRVARQLGIRDPERKTKARLSDLISVEFASRVLDQYMKNTTTEGDQS